MIALIWQNDWHALGCRLAKSLIAAKHEVKVFIKNAQPNSFTSAQEFLPAGALAKSQVETLDQASTVITLLNTPQEVEDVYLSSGGILQHVTPSSLLIDLSTSSPRLVKELHALASVHDHSFVEAPLQADLIAPDTGNFTLFAAGEPDSLKRALPLLQILTPQVLELGLPGSGSTLKLASQIALANTLMGVVESVMFLQVAGMSPQQIIAALEHNTAASALARAFGKKVIDEEFYQGVSLQQFFFDLTTALDVADEYGLALPGLETAHQLYDLLVLVGAAKKGIQALALIYCDEERCSKHGLNWTLAQQAMDVYERVGDGDYDSYYYDDEDDYEGSGCEYHPHHKDNEPPAMSRFFSSN